MIHHILPTLAPHLPLTHAERTKLTHVANTVSTANFTAEYLSYPFLIFNNPTAANLHDTEVAKTILLRELKSTLSNRKLMNNTKPANKKKTPQNVGAYALNASCTPVTKANLTASRCMRALATMTQ